MGSVVGQHVSAPVGAEILRLVTAGIYADPLTVYREYIQNAADAIHGGRMQEAGRVEIAIAASERSVTIRDDGPGLSMEEAKRALIPIAASEKPRENCRGFRGIGRLAGLAFGESVTFLTRSGPNAPVVRVRWDGGRLRKTVEAGQSLEATLASCVTVDVVDGVGRPAQFFEVSVEGVSRYAAASIMNREAVRKYIAEVCPVPFSDEFPYARSVANLVADGHGRVELNIVLDGEDRIVRRPHGSDLSISEGNDNEFVTFEEIKVTGLGDRRWSAVGWIAHTRYLGAISRERGVRGVRARVGNMQIGDEGVFDHLFSEDRFNRWCIAEVHVIDPAIVPNVRRDYFEPSPHLRNLENQLGAVCRRLEKRCRTASRQRRGLRRHREFMQCAEDVLKLAASGYLGEDRARRLISDTILDVSRRREKRNGSDDDGDGADGLRALEALEDRLRNFQVPRQREICGLRASDVRVYRQVFGILAEISRDPMEAMRTIEAVLKMARTGHGG